jgi:hypothetical protein
METIFRTLPDTLVGTIGGHVVEVPTPVCTPEHLIAQIQAVLDAAAPGVWVVQPSPGAGDKVRIAKVLGTAFSWALSPAWGWLTGETTLSGTGLLYESPGDGRLVRAHGLRVSPPRRAWTRLKASDSNAGLVATVLDTQTYFDLRAWLTPTETEAFAALADRPFVVGFGAAPWTELDTTGYKPLRVTDARGVSQPRLVGSTAALVEYQLETVLVKP